MNNYLLWIRVTAMLQIISACVHAMSFLKNPLPANETERTLHELMSTYRPDVGPLFHPTSENIFMALSACFSLLYLLGGVINLYLAQKHLPPQVWKGLVSINLVVFGGAFSLMLMLTYLPFIALTGVVFLSLSMAYATNHIHRFRLPQN
jgi:hypothetical protein